MRPIIGGCYVHRLSIAVHRPVGAHRFSFLLVSYRPAGPRFSSETLAAASPAGLCCCWRPLIHHREIIIAVFRRRSRQLR